MQKVNAKSKKVNAKKYKAKCKFKNNRRFFDSLRYASVAQDDIENKLVGDVD